MPRIGIVGDIHGDFDARDAALLGAEGYDLVLLTGDLETLVGPSVARRAAEAIARLETPSILIPGNHDGASFLATVTEAVGPAFARSATARGMLGRWQEIASRLGSIHVGGYDLHPFDLGGPGGRFDVIVGRPHSMGGPRIAFASVLEERWGIDGMNASARRLMDLVDESDAPALLFLAHNGPTGLGVERDSIWGRDFGGRTGDWGDPDLARAVDHARRRGKRIVAVIAGHMHHHVKGGGQRRWLETRGQVLYINPARVPRIFESCGVSHRHHVRLVFDDQKASAEQILLEA